MQLKSKTPKLQPLKYFEQDYDVEQELTTTWINNTKHTFTFSLMQDRKIGIFNTGNTFQRITLKPGEKITLTSAYDNAVRTLNKEKTMIVGGYCPFLTKRVK